MPPEGIGTILDRATAGTDLTFNDGTPGRQTLMLSTGNDIWEISTRESVYHGPPLGYIFSPDGKVVLAQTNGSASLYNWRSKKRTMLENPAPQWVSMSGGGGFANIYGLAAFSNSGNLIAGARPNGSLYLLDTNTGKVVHTLREGGNAIFSYRGIDEHVTCIVRRLAFSSDDTVLASGEVNGNISLWNTKTGDLLATLSDQDRQPCDGTTPQALDPFSEVLSLDFSPSGRLLASQDSYGVVRVWQVSSHNVVYSLPFILQPSKVLVRFSPDGQFLVSSGGFFLKGEAYHQMYLVWNAASGRLLRAFSSSAPGGFAFLSNGNLVIAQVSNGRVKVESWALRSRLRIPFVSSAKENVGPTDSGLLQAYEEQAMQTLELFQSNAGRYMSGLGKGGFPQTLEDTAKDLVSNRQVFREQKQGYRYVYSPGPGDDQGRITSYVLSARPLLYQQTGTRSFRVDQTGQVHATEEGREATRVDAVFRSLKDATEVGAAIQKAAAAAAQQEIAPHLARAQMLFQQRQYQAAIGECDAVLRLDSSNQQAVNLKAQIQQTMSILGVQ
jgi:WD40 repeat protein